MFTVGYLYKNYIRPVYLYNSSPARLTLANLSLAHLSLAKHYYLCYIITNPERNETVFSRFQIAPNGVVFFYLDYSLS